MSDEKHFTINLDRPRQMYLTLESVAKVESVVRRKVIPVLKEAVRHGDF
jgi:hypothetical protein